MDKNITSFIKDVKEDSIGSLNNNVLWVVSVGYGVVTGIAERSISKGFFATTGMLGFTIVLNGLGGAIINRLDGK